MPIKAIIFDFDETLFQTKKFRVKAIQYWAKHFYDLDYSETEIAALWGTPFRKYFEILLKGKGDLDKAIEQYFSITPDFKSQPFPGTLEAIQELKKEFTLAIVSAASKEMLIKDMKAANFPNDLFDFIQGDGETDFHKPDLRVFEPVLAFLKAKGIDKSEMIYVGDVIDDFLAANGAGLGFYGISGRGVSAEQWQEAGAKTIAEIGELVALTE